MLAAAHGKEALDLLRTYDARIDLLITDIDIPKLDALELCAAAAKERPEIKICAMSLDHAAASRAAEKRVPFFVKPLDPEILRQQFAHFLT